MEVSGKKVLLCDCEGTMPLDGRAIAACLGGAGADEFRIHRQLCRAEIERVKRAAGGGAAVIVACTQEAPVFADAVRETGAETPLRFVNIREHAGWSDEARAATPKIAALIAEAALDIPPARSLTLASSGRLLVLGRDETALAAARRVADRLDVTLLLTAGAGDVVPPERTDLVLARGEIVAARGRFGAFEVEVAGFAFARPSSRAGLGFEEAARRRTIESDLILDLRGEAPLFPAPGERDGYVRPDPGDRALVERALFDLADMVGEFEKPIHVEYRADICTHCRSGKTGCTLCIDHCPTGAVAPDGEGVAVDHGVCAGCGDCASVCPTGAITYALPGRHALLERLRVLIGTFRAGRAGRAGGGAAGGVDPVLLVHDLGFGEEMLAMMARFGRGLPAHVLPFSVNRVTQAGLDLIVAALAYGAGRVLFLLRPDRDQRPDALHAQVELAEAVLGALGYGAGRAVVLDRDDPTALEAELRGLAPLAPLAPADFLPTDGKRTAIMLALRHLHARAPAPVERLALPPGAPFGTIELRTEGCTVCLSCVGACPTGALLDTPERPALRIREEACVQCGLCRATCPEAVVTLVPRLNFTDEARSEIVLKEEEPFACVACGKPFATRSTIRKMVADLGRLPAFADDPRALRRLEMCEDCRVADLFADPHPLAGEPRPAPRTTDDEIARRDAGEAPDE